MTYLRNYWYCAGLSEEVGAKPMRRVICERPVVLFRTESGRTAALEDRCSHRQAPLSMGRVVGEEIQCMYHGLVFDCSGACVHVPQQDTVPARAKIASYRTAERWGYVWLWWGEAALADESRIPQLGHTVDDKRRTLYFYFYLNANFQLMADNLLDISHTDFLHAHSIGSKTSGKGQVDAPKVTMQTRTEGERVYSVRTVSNTMLSPLAAKWGSFTRPVDRISTQMWEPPNTVHIQLELKNDEGHITINMAHIMTPETAKTTHYFMHWTRDFGMDNINYPTDADIRREQIGVVTQDDIPMVQAQQANLDAFGAVQDMPVIQDKLVNAVHRLLRDIYRDAGASLPAQVERMAIDR